MTIALCLGAWILVACIGIFIIEVSNLPESYYPMAVFWPIVFVVALVAGPMFGPMWAASKLGSWFRLRRTTDGRRRREVRRDRHP